MRIDFPSHINSNILGFNFLLELYSKISGVFSEHIYMDFRNNVFIEANLLAVLGAIINKNSESNFNGISIENLSSKLEILLKRNHFLSHFGGLKVEDSYDTTIKYRKFSPKDSIKFSEYIDKELLSKKLMPEMSRLLGKDINGSISEVFNNSVIHSNCQSIYTCGQCFPTKKKLEFTVVDMGISIPQKVNSFLRWKTLSGADSIAWAVEEGNTTKDGPIPGGVGLSLIREFLQSNKGKIQIVSGDGYWEQNMYNIILSESFELRFPGTIVNFEFNLDDAFYCFKHEVDIGEIF